MTRYAEDTSVPSDRSRAEIERTLQRYGADRFLYGWEDGRAMIGFRADGRHVRFILPLPDRNAREFQLTPTGRFKRSDTDIEKAYEQAVKQRWRALALVVKAKLEAVEAGITTFEDEFLAHILLPDGRSFGEWAAPQVERAYAKGLMPSMLPGLPAPKSTVLETP